MPRCPSCQAAIHGSEGFCPSCGTAIGDPSRSPTQPAWPEGSPPAASPGPTGTERLERSPSDTPLPPSDPSDEGRFLPGTLLAGRYRIVGLLGRGGMGEVYRAYDSKLGQTVALKFLPENLAGDPGRLARFYNEVRISRQISHPNVCRVYDIGEGDGQAFLSMEYIDGEDLASLLRRIGRLPEAKATEIARQMCAGLAAAHERGVLHRDLKPANIMIDGRGRARITDFGLAGLATDSAHTEIRTGTPAYMAPEQLEGKEVSVRSDLYSLGLVLFEVFTGESVHKSDRVTQVRGERESEPPPSPSSIVGGLDPAVERAILRCLAPEPEDRPASALDVAASLPGGDPLQAALEAGETPSPEMVAATGGEGSLRPAVALALLLPVLAGALLLALSARSVQLIGHVPMEKPPPVLAAAAREIIQELGYAEAVADRAHGFTQHMEVLERLAEGDDSASRWAPLATGRPAGYGFWYRQGPGHLVPQGWSGVVTPGDPPPLEPGMVGLELDPRGRLIGFDAVPAAVEGMEREAEPREPSWDPLFAHAGLEQEGFTPVEPVSVPPVFSDLRRAWEGPDPDNPGRSLLVEAASHQGRAVWLRVHDAWSRPEPGAAPATEAGIDLLARFAGWLNVGVIVAILLVGALLARRNILLGRGDRQGAFRLALVAFALELSARLLTMSHVPLPVQEWDLVEKAVARALFVGGLLWVVYMALEPYVRRRWPDLIVSWNRLLAGRAGDPLVGTHLLIGTLTGVVMTAAVHIQHHLPGWLGWPPSFPGSIAYQALAGRRYMLGELLGMVEAAIIQATLILFLAVLFRVALRRRWLAAPALILLLGAPNVFTPRDPWLALALGLLLATLLVAVLLRFGLLAFATAFLTFSLLLRFPITLDPSAWYVGASVMALGTVVLLAVYGFLVSLAGRPLFRIDL